MKIAEVIGTAISDIKTDWLDNPTFKIIQPLTATGEKDGNSMVALDNIGVSMNELVFITQGSSCRQTDQTKDKPVDVLICGIIDNVESNDKYTYQKDIGFIK